MASTTATILKNYLSLALEILFRSAHRENTVPRTDLLEMAKRLYVPLLLLACCSILVGLVIGHKPSLPFAVTWIILVFISIIIYYRTALYVYFHEKVERSALVGAITILLLQYLTLLSGYGSLGWDPYSLWLLYLLPLMLVSKGGTTRHWFRFILLVSIFLLCFRFSSIMLNSGDEYTLGLILLDTQMLVTFSHVGFLIFVGAAFHAVVREMHSYQRQIQTEREMVALLTSKKTLSESYRAIAETLVEQGLGPYSFVLLWDSKNEHLKLVGNAGRRFKRWHETELRKSEGITGTVATSEKAILVKDIRAPEWEEVYFHLDEFDDVRSELAVPVMYEDAFIGVLDVESSEVNAFDKNDQALLKAWAEAFALTYKHFTAIEEIVGNTHQVIKSTIELGQKYNVRNPLYDRIQYKSWFADVGELACQYFTADMVAFIRLAAGTQFPLLPPFFWPRNEYKPIQQAFYHRDNIPKDSLIWQMIDDWEIRCWCSGSEWQTWRESADKWLVDALLDNDITTLVFVPVGSPENPVGMLFIGYIRPEIVSKSNLIALSGFATAIEKSYQPLSSWLSELQRVGLRIHQSIVPTTEFLFAALENLQDSIIKHVGPTEDKEKLIANHSAIKTSLLKLRELTKFATLRDRYNLENITLEHALLSTASDFEEARPESLRVVVRNAGCAEGEQLATRQALFWVAVEAMANAVEHGEADFILVELARIEHAFKLAITDNGKGLPVDPQTNNPHGIFRLRRFLRLYMGAQVNIEHAPDGGTQVTMLIPVQPRR